MKRTTTVLLMALILSIPSFAGINFVEGKTWKEVLAMARQQKKLIFLDAYATWCGPCKYLQKNVFTDEEVGKYYNGNFINVKMDMEAGEGIRLSEELGVSSYPTLFFINGDGKVVHKTVGAMDAADFISLGKTAINPETQFYTVKAKAASGKIAPKVFHDWVHTAEALDDPDTKDLVAQYLSHTTFPLIEKEMLFLIMDHEASVNKTQLDLLYTKRAEASKLLEVSLEAYEMSLLKLVVNYAEAGASKDGIIDFASFRKNVEAYYPKHGLVEMQIRKASYHVERKENALAMSTLSDLMKNPVLGVEDMALSIVNATNLIAEENKGKEWIDKVQAYQVRKSEEGKKFYKDVALLLLYYRLQDQENTELYSQRILMNEEAPESIKEMVRGLNE